MKLPNFYVVFFLKRESSLTTFHSFGIVKLSSQEIEKLAFGNHGQMFGQIIYERFGKIEVNQDLLFILLLDSTKPIKFKQSGLIIYSINENYMFSFETLDTAKKFKNEIDKIFKEN